MEINSYTKSLNILKREERVVGRAVHIRFYPVVVERAEGVYVYDVDGRKLLDFCASWAVANTGYGHPRIAEVIIDQLRRTPTLSFTTFSCEVIVELAEKLVEITPGRFSKKVVFGHSGSDANEAVFKLVPYYNKRPRIISFIGSYHGQTMGSYSMSGHKAQSRLIGFANVVKVPYPYCYRCPFNLEYPECSLQCIHFIEKYVMKTIAPADTVSFIITEPIQSDGGDVVPPNEFMKELYRIAQENDIVFVVDEVKVGMGRTGKMFCTEHYNVIPDAIVLGKPLASGLPISAVVMRSEIADSLESSHLFTLAPHPVSARAALETIRIIQEEHLIDNAANMGNLLLKKLCQLKDTYEIIGDVRGKGLIIGIELVRNRKTKEPAIKETAKVVFRAWELGLIVTYTGIYSNVIELTPPLIIGKEHVEEAVRILEEAISDVVKSKVPDEKVKPFTGW